MTAHLAGRFEPAGHVFRERLLMVARNRSDSVEGDRECAVARRESCDQSVAEIYDARKPLRDP